MNKLINYNKLIQELLKYNLNGYSINTKEDFNKLNLLDILEIANSFDIDINNYIVADIIQLECL